MTQDGVTDEMVDAYLKANEAYWREVDTLEPKAGTWRQGTPREATRVSLRAALSAEKDAARYQILRAGLYGFLATKMQKRKHGWGNEGDILKGEELDTAIDAAIQFFGKRKADQHEGQ